MHKVLSDGLRVGIKSLMATVRGPRPQSSGVSSQRGLGSIGGQDSGVEGVSYTRLWPC